MPKYENDNRFVCGSKLYKIPPKVIDESRVNTIDYMITRNTNETDKDEQEETHGKIFEFKTLVPENMAIINDFLCAHRFSDVIIQADEGKFFRVTEKYSNGNQSTYDVWFISRMVLTCMKRKGEPMDKYQMDSYVFSVESEKESKRLHDECFAQFKKDHPHAHVRRSSMRVFTSKECRAFFIYTE